MADKLTLPKAKFSHELTAGPVDATMKAAEAKTGKLFSVPVDKVRVIPGFNLRVETPDYIAHRDGIRASIAANGFNPKKPLSGYVGVEGDENVIYVTDGHTRLSAVQDFNADPDTAEKDEITHVPVLVAPKETVLADLLVELHTANTGRELTPLEKGILAKRLLGEDMKKADIAKRLGFTSRYLDDVLLLANADGKVKQHVASGAVSSTMAIQALRADADGAGEKIEAAVAKAAKSGKTKATKKDTAPRMVKTKLAHSFDAGDDMKEIVKAVAALIRSTVKAEDGEDDAKLSVTGGTVNLVVELPAPPKAAKAKPAKKAAAKKAKPAADDAEEAKPAKKAKAKPAAEKPAKKAKAKPPVEGAEELEDDDGEEAIMPPKVDSDPDVPEDDVDI